MMETFFSLYVAHAKPALWSRMVVIPNAYVFLSCYWSGNNQGKKIIQVRENKIFVKRKVGDN